MRLTSWSRSRAPWPTSTRSPPARKPSGTSNSGPRWRRPTTGCTIACTPPSTTTRRIGSIDGNGVCGARQSGMGGRTSASSRLCPGVPLVGADRRVRPATTSRRVVRGDTVPRPQRPGQPPGGHTGPPLRGERPGQHRTLRVAEPAGFNMAVVYRGRSSSVRIARPISCRFALSSVANGNCAAGPTTRNGRAPLANSMLCPVTTYGRIPR